MTPHTGSSLESGLSGGSGAEFVVVSPPQAHNQQKYSAKHEALFLLYFLHEPVGIFKEII